MPLERYDDLLADVRYDGKFHSIRKLVQPNDSEVKQIAAVLHQAKDFVAASQQFVHSFTSYEPEVGDYWTTPAEVLADQAGDCDDKAILLLSILRNYIPADKVYAAFGTWQTNGKPGGHMWIVLAGNGVEDIIIEATAPHGKPIKGKYNVQALFNDLYAFATDPGIADYKLKPVRLQEEIYA